MPGICGIFGKRHEQLYKNQLLKMVACMMQNPSFSNGCYINPDLNAYVGWVAHPGSYSDCLPIFNETKDVVLFFAGEGFPEKETIIKLKSTGHAFDPSNASSLIHLYEENGIDFLLDINGWFSGVLIDFRNKESVLFVDRYGMQRIYFHEKEDDFYFSSEAKCLLKVLPELRRLDPESMGHYFTCGSVLENRTLFSGVSLLPGGSSWRFQKGICTARKKYFLPSEWENLEILEKSKFHDALHETIEKIIPPYLESRSSIGMSLTGGLDTRIIMSHIGSSATQLPCYTFGGMYRDCFDVKIAKKVAEACGQSFRILPIEESFLTNFSDFAEKTVYRTDGVSNVCGSHEIYLNNLAKEIAPIRLTGLFGSEIMRSVAYIKADLPKENIFNPEFEPHNLNALKTFQFAKNRNPVSNVAFNIIPWQLQGNLLAAQSELTVRTPFMDNRLVKLMYQIQKDERAGEELSLRLILSGNPELGKIRTDRGLKADRFYIFTLLTRIYYDFLFKAEYGFSQGMPHWLSYIENYLDLLKMEKYIIGRNKIEHYRLWFKNNLSDYIKNILLDGRSMRRDYLKEGIIEEVVKGHMSGKRNYTNEINKLLTMELIQRIFIENE